MALQIDELPEPPSRNDSRDVFSNKANLFAASLPGLVSQANALAEEVETKALQAEAATALTEADRIQTASDRAQIAIDKAQVAADKTSVQSSVGAAAGHATSAQNAADSAAESALQAEAALTSKPIIQNTNAITQNQIIPAGRNALSVGPIAINDGVTVTVAPGSRWRIL